MFCPSCQARNREANIFCTSCGKRLAPPSPDQVWEQRPPEGLVPAEEGPGESGWSSHRSTAEGEGSFLPMRYGAPATGTESWPQINGMAVRPYEPRMPHFAAGGYSLAPSVVCANCGFPRASRIETCPRCGRMVLNNSGQGQSVPAELASSWNWGAFMMPLFWSIAHETWFGLLAIVPGLNIVVSFVLASRGNELAWQNRRFHSVEHFQEVQRVWRNCALGLGAVSAALLVMLIFSQMG